MNIPTKKRGSTLVLVMMLLLIFLGLTVVMTFNAQSEIQLANGVKLAQFNKMAAISAMERTRANITDYWVPADPFGSSGRQEWRFGTLLAIASPDPLATEDYGGLMPTDTWGDKLTVNGGLMTLNYKVWVANNPDDPAYTMTGMDLGDGPLDPKLYDMDGKVVVTIQVFNPTDAVNPVATHSALIGLSGADFVVLHDDAVREGDVFEAGNLGRGSSGSASTITLGEVDSDLSSETP